MDDLRFRILVMAIVLCLLQKFLNGSGALTGSWLLLVSFAGDKKAGALA